MTEARTNAIQELNRLNRHPAFKAVDIVTFTGFMADAELPAYVAGKASQALDFDTMAAVAKALGVKLTHGFVA